MSALLVDIGNTRVKWARLENGRLGRQQAAPHSKWKMQDFGRHLFRSPQRIDQVIVVSVATQSLERSLSTAARKFCQVTPKFIETQRHAAGVTTRYEEPWRLGVDRFVACIGAHHLLPGKPVCVVDIGTAMTIDLVDSDGVHRGGAILPGPSLMVQSLLADTSGIQRRASGLARGGSLFARNTRAAIEQGSSHAAAAVTERAVVEAHKVLKKKPHLLLTGGGADRIHRLVSTPHRLVPDLVLRGLAALT